MNTTVIAGHLEHPLVRLQVGRLDARETFERRGRAQIHLAIDEGGRPLHSERHRIALAISIARIAIHLIKKQVAHRHRAQAHRRIGAGHDQHATGEFLHQLGVAGIPASGVLHPAGEFRAGFDQRIDALLGDALGAFHRGLHQQHWPRRVVDDVAQPVQSRFCAP